ncbi:unnamed protein product [Polarella glacialis]|uniref:Uncharacterized protein n=1 Tax=Polarella glacialis TaxID=89957 RepID=A0A813JQD3_POLGL|nr:unnamed protein product [Polarella glacialis]
MRNVSVTGEAGTLRQDKGCGAEKEKVWSRHFRPSRCYLRVQVTFERRGVEPPALDLVRATVAEALQGAFGTCGSALVDWSLVAFEGETGVGILRVRPEDLIQLRFATTLITRCGGRRCRADVLAAAPSLAALACAR